MIIQHKANLMGTGGGQLPWRSVRRVQRQAKVRGTVVSRSSRAKLKSLSALMHQRGTVASSGKKYLGNRPPASPPPDHQESVRDDPKLTVGKLTAIQKAIKRRIPPGPLSPSGGHPSPGTIAGCQCIRPLLRPLPLPIGCLDPHSSPSSPLPLIGLI